MKSLIKRSSNRRTLPHPEECCYNDDVPLVLPSRRCRVIPADPAAWFDAINHGQVQRVREMLPNIDVDVTYFNEEFDLILSGVHLAALYGDMRTLRLLIQAHCNVNVTARPRAGASKQKWLGATPLHFAVAEGYLWAVRDLIHAGCQVNTTFRSTLKIGGEDKLIKMDAMYLAAERGRAKITYELLRHGGDANAVSRVSDGTVDTSALHMAVKGRHMKVVRLLLSYGADVNAADNVECCPLLWAVCGGSAEVVHVLLRKKPNLDARMTVQDVGYLTPLQLAALRGYDLICWLLVEAGAPLDDVCPLSGKTALHLAAGNGHMAIVCRLVAKGAAVNVLDYSGRSALDDAKHCNHYDVMSLLTDEMEKGVQKYGVFFQEGRNTSAGVCLIINIKEFAPGTEMQDRPSSSHDVDIIQRAFKHLGFKVIVHENLPALQFVEVLRSVRDNKVQALHETFVCCIMSHGDMGSLVGADGDSVKVGQLTELLKAELCPQLAGKTKIFVLESCQGRSEDIHLADIGDQPDSQRITEAHPAPSPTKIIPEEDFLIWTASLPGNVAYIGDAGSDFLQTLGQRLLDITETPVDIKVVIRDVNRTMAARRVPRGGPNVNNQLLQAKQVPCVHDTVTSDTRLRHRQRTDS